MRCAASFAAHPSLGRVRVEYAVAFPNTAELKGSLPPDDDVTQVLEFDYVVLAAPANAMTDALLYVGVSRSLRFRLVIRTIWAESVPASGTRSAQIRFFDDVYEAASQSGRRLTCRHRPMVR